MRHQFKSSSPWLVTLRQMSRSPWPWRSRPAGSRAAGAAARRLSQDRGGARPGSPPVTVRVRVSHWASTGSRSESHFESVTQLPSSAWANAHHWVIGSSSEIWESSYLLRRRRSVWLGQSRPHSGCSARSQCRRPPGGPGAGSPGLPGGGRELEVQVATH